MAVEHIVPIPAVISDDIAAACSWSRSRVRYIPGDMENEGQTPRMAAAQAHDRRDDDTVLVLSQPTDTNQWTFSIKRRCTGSGSAPSGSATSTR